MQRFGPAFEEMKESFASIDENGSGSIEVDEFVALMLKLDHSRPEGALRMQFVSIDTNHDGRISEEEFHSWLGMDGR